MSLLAEQWKRHSNDLCFRWGTTNTDSQSAFPLEICPTCFLLVFLPLLCSFCLPGKTRPWFQSSTKVYDPYSDKDVYVVSLWRRFGCVVMSILALMPIIAATVLAHMGIFT